MAETHTVIMTYQRPGAEVKGSAQYSGDSFVAIVNQAVPDPSSDLELQVSLDVSQIVSLILSCDVDLTIETNADDATGGNTLNIAAGSPYVWTTDSLDSLLLTEDVLKMFLTASGGGDGVFNMVALIDPTV